MCQRYSPSKDSLLDKWFILMFLNEFVFVEASAPFLLKLYSLLESHQQCVCHVQPGPNPGKLYQNIPECSIPFKAFCKGIWSFMKVTNGIQEFKEAFNMIDHNRFGQNINKLFLGEIWPNVTFLDHRDGFIDNEDLHDMLASLGKV